MGDDEPEQARIEISGEASSMVASWLGIDSDEEDDEEAEDEDLTSDKFSRAPRSHALFACPCRP